MVIKVFPYKILGQGVLDISGVSGENHKYLDISLNPVPNLKMNENYWFAYSTYCADLSGNQQANIFARGNMGPNAPGGSLGGGNLLSVLDISFNTTQGGPAGGGQINMNDITDLSGAPLRYSFNNTWFRLYDASSSFLVGPVGPTGECGCTGSLGPTGPCQDQLVHLPQLV